MHIGLLSLSQFPLRGRGFFPSVSRPSWGRGFSGAFDPGLAGRALMGGRGRGVLPPVGAWSHGFSPQAPRNEGLAAHWVTHPHHHLLIFTLAHLNFRL